MPRLQGLMATLVAIGVAALAACTAILGGCGGSTPSNFPTGRAASVEPEVAALVSAWASAQQSQDAEALRRTLDPDYDYNGVTPEHAAHLLLVPRTDETRLSRFDYTLLQPPAHVHAADEHHHHQVMVRVRLSGVVGAEVVAGLATGTGDTGEHEHEHVHTHSVATRHATVPVQGRCDVVLEISEASGIPLIVAQRVHLAALEYGGAFMAPVLSDVHVEPEQSHPGDEVHVHAKYALLPSGGAGRVSVGDHAPVPAELAKGVVHADVVLPDHEGRFLARLELYAGNVEVRSACMTIAEREVTITHED